MTSRLHAYSFKRTVRVAVAIVLFLGLVALISWLFVRSMTIENVVVDAKGMSIALDKNRFGPNLLFLETTALEKQLVAQYPLLSRVSFEKQYPHTLIVRLEKREPIAVLVSENNFFAVDPSGIVVESGMDIEGLPHLVFTAGIFGVGSSVDNPSVLTSLQFLQSVQSFFAIDSFKMKDTATIQAKHGNTNIFIPKEGDMRSKADTLQLIVEGFRIKGILPTVIDLRYEKPVITN